MKKYFSIQQLIGLEEDSLNWSNIKLVRHQDSRLEYRDIFLDRKIDEILEYQKSQSKNIFQGVDYIISFIGLEKTKSLFVGIFKVEGVNEVKNRFVYDLSKTNICKNMIERVVIDWGKGTRNWHQWSNRNKPKEIIEILPKGYIGNFPGLTNFYLSFDRLKKLIDNPDANRDWKNHLSSVNGIYMILDKKTGLQYIGSASGKNGIWQRWSDYAKKYQYENTRLKELCDTSDKYYKNFQYTVLQTLPSNLSQDEVRDIEKIYKEKFGSKAHGLNEN